MICLTDCYCITGNAVDIPSQAGTNGPPSLMGESPPAGWEGGSELAFPLDDVPKDASTKPSRDGELLINCSEMSRVLEKENVHVSTGSYCTYR